MKNKLLYCAVFLLICITIVAQTVDSRKISGTNPESLSGFSASQPLLVPLCGSYNVGSGQTYTTLTAAIADLNARGVSCAVSFILTDNTYPSETFPITIGIVSGTSFTNTVTIKPGPGKTPVITGSSTTAILIMNGCKYVIIDGSNSGGSDKSLTWTNTNTATNTYTIELMNPGSAPSSNITIKNCLVKASSQITKNTYCIFLDNTNGGYDSITISNNTLFSARFGIQFQGVASAPATNGQIINNIIGSLTDAQAIQFKGIFLRTSDNTVIQGNEIMGAPLGNANTAQAGIWIPASALNTKIRQNKIHDWFYTGSGGFGNYGIYYSAGAGSQTEISNNVITNIKADGDNGSQDWMTAGIYINGGGNIRILHNSVWLTGATLQPAYNGWSAGLSIYSGVTNLIIRNNIFKNSQTLASGTTGNTYAVYCASPNTAFASINYNDYYDDGVNPNIGFLGSNQPTLAAWQSATGQDANSVNLDPLFTGVNDLHTTVNGLAKAGIYMALVPVDITGAGRTNPPDIGAYQFSANPVVATTPATSITSSTVTLNGTINASNATVTSGFEYGLTTAYGTPVAGSPATVTGTTVTGITANITGLTASTLYHYRATGTSGGVVVNGPDQTFTTLTALTPPIVVTTAATNITAITATLNGTVNPVNFTTTVSFDYGLTTSYGTNVPGTPNPVSGNTPAPVSANISGLLPCTTYHFRVNGVSAGGTSNGNDLTFTTTSAAPYATTQSASSVGSTTANLNGLITANCLNTTVSFDYGLTASYGSTIPGIPLIVTGNIPTSVTALLTGLTQGATYHFRVCGTNASGNTCGGDMVFTTGCPQAGPAGPITGSPTACQGQCGYVYTVAPIANASGYNWTLPNGGTITAGNNTNSITVCYSPTALSGTVIVFGTASCGNGADSQFPVTINPPATPTVAGPASVCINSTGNVYTTQTGMTNYQWTVTGGTITGGGGTANNTVTVTWTSSGAKTVCVNYTSLLGCPAITPYCYTVTVNPLPSPIITGSGVACTNPGYVYSCQAGMTSYVWTITAGGVITNGNNTNTITVTWNTAGSQNVSVNFTNANGCTAASPTVFPITVSSTTIPVITGVNSLCVNSGYYFYSTQAGMTSYLWNISAGGVLVAGQNTNTIQVQWPQTGAQWVSADFTNAAGCYAPTPTVFNVTVNPAPDPAGSISGTLTVCAGANGVAYSCLPVPNALTYVWTLPPGATIASGSGTNSITVNFAANASSGNILVYGNNLCGNGPASPPFPVTVNALPANAGNVTGPATVCIGSTGVVYSVLPIANATAYVWTVPAGATINGPSNTSSITVDFGPAAVSGNITVLGTNSCGSGVPSPNFAVTVNPVPLAPIIHPDAVMAGDTLFSSVLTGNQWYFNGNLIPGATGYFYVTDNIGDYTDVIIAGGCSSPPSNSVFAHGVGISEKDATSVNIFPVPNDGLFKLTINCPSKQTFTLHVYNSLGVVIFEQKDIEVRGLTERMVDLRPAPNGVYSVVLTNSDQQIVKKIVINK